MFATKLLPDNYGISGVYKKSTANLQCLQEFPEFANALQQLVSIFHTLQATCHQCTYPILLVQETSVILNNAQEVYASMCNLWMRCAWRQRESELSTVQTFINAAARLDSSEFWQVGGVLNAVSLVSSPYVIYSCYTHTGQIPTARLDIPILALILIYILSWPRNKHVYVAQDRFMRF
jgi:hypothetical protein